MQSLQSCTTHLQHLEEKISAIVAMDLIQTTDIFDVFVFVGLMIYAWLVVLPPNAVSPAVVMALCAQYGLVLTSVALGMYVLICQRDLEVSTIRN